MARGNRGKAAYFLVNLDSLPAEHRAEILEDAFDGGKEFGLKVVEEYINGPARQPVYGVYYGEDADKWSAAKAEFGIIDDDDAAEEDELRQAAEEDELRQAAEAKATSEGEKQRAAEEAAVAAVVNPTPEADKATVNKAKTAR